MADTRESLTVFALVLAMTLAAFLGVRQPIGSVILALLSAAWLTVDQDWEGGVLIPISSTHGITQADLAGVLGLLIAVWQLWAWHRRRRR